jgi:hypothetical protein
VCTLENANDATGGHSVGRIGWRRPVGILVGERGDLVTRRSRLPLRTRQHLDSDSVAVQCAIAIVPAEHIDARGGAIGRNGRLVVGEARIDAQRAA